MGGGAYWNHFVRLSVCSSVRLSDRVLSISPEQLNLPNPVWWCFTTRQRVMREKKKKMFTIFNIKVTARAYKKRDFFLLYLLNWWSVCNQTWFGGTAS